MPSKPPGEFNPLSLTSLAESVVTTLMRQELHQLPPLFSFSGCGIYAIYMTNPTGPYRRLAEFTDPRTGQVLWPVYVGKAVPKGTRKGGGEFDAGSENAIANRLRQHANSIDAAENLVLADFSCRFLVTAPVRIRLAESAVIQRYRPVWNAVLDGFGNHDPGARRATQHRSPWDVLHPGRAWAEKLGTPPYSARELRARVEAFLAEDAPL